MKTAMITGCSSGYGLETARYFLAQGWGVVATMRTPREGVLERSERLRVLALDVTNPASIAAALGTSGPIDVLVNNAGIGAFGAFEATPMATVREVFETNTFGVMAMTQAVLPGFRARRSGVVVNVTSSATLAPMPMVAPYTASKMAIEGFTASLALELEGFHEFREQHRLAPRGGDPRSVRAFRREHLRFPGTTELDDEPVRRGGGGVACRERYDRSAPLPRRPRRRGVGARLIGLDGTPGAVVAADRLALSEAEEGSQLLLRRLTVFYGYFALLAALGAVAGRVRRFPFDTDARDLALLVDLQSGLALVLAAAFGALRFLVRGSGISRALDAVATTAVCVTAAVALSIVPYAVTVDVSAVSFFILFFALRAALIPSTPWLATLVAALCAIPFILGLGSLYRRAELPDPSGATFAALRAMAGGVAGVYVVSKTIYGLRRVVERAVKLGQYVIHEKIGEGGMGTVYRASHAMLKRPTAIKLIAPDCASVSATARFEREVKAASRLSHPNNVAIYDFGRTRGGIFYYAMELLDGEDLGRLVERAGPQPVSRTLHVLRQVTAALGEAHDTGLVHRDVKPENVMLCTRGGVRDFVKVLDFGLVKDITAERARTITAETSIVGTPLYMAPEAIMAPQTVGPAADVYAVGGIAYFLLTGRPPFDEGSLVQICAAHVLSAPEPPSRYAPSPLSPELDALILRCLEKDPARRPTMRELGHELEASVARS
jgi:NADP-dependent 3-hydroxy acid dehydrogenase YdfG